MRCAYRMSKRHTTVIGSLNPRSLMIIILDFHPRMCALDQKVLFVVDKTTTAAKGSNPLATADKKQKVDTMQSPKATGNKGPSQRYTHTDSATPITIASTTASISITSINISTASATTACCPTTGTNTQSNTNNNVTPLPWPQHTVSATRVHDKKYHC